MGRCTALLMEDGWYNGFSVTHWLQPLLTLGVECSDDALTARANELTAVTVNPKAEAAAKIANLVGGDGEKVKAFVRFRQAAATQARASRVESF